MRLKNDSCLHYFLFHWIVNGDTVILKGRKGVIQSLGFPNPYPAHLKSMWKISVDKGLLVKLQITDLAITGETGQCKEDKLIIADQYSTLGKLQFNFFPQMQLSLFNKSFVCPSS